MFEISQIRYFIEVARQGSFTGASKALRISQPAISKMVKKLEEDCGHRLFHRNKIRISLTEEGRLLLHHCENIYSELDLLEKKLQNRKGTLSGKVEVGMSDNLCNYFLPDF